MGGPVSSARASSACSSPRSARLGPSPRLWRRPACGVRPWRPQRAGAGHADLLLREVPLRPAGDLREPGSGSRGADRSRRRHDSRRRCRSGAVPDRRGTHRQDRPGTWVRRQCRKHIGRRRGSSGRNRRRQTALKARQAHGVPERCTLVSGARRRGDPRFLRGAVADQPQLPQGIAEHRRRTERPQAQAPRRAGCRLSHGQRRRGAADSAPREGRIPPPQRDDDSARDRAGVHVEGRSRLGEGGRQRQDPRRRHVTAGRRRAVPGDDARSDSEGRVSDTRRPPSVDSRDPDRRGSEQRPPELRAEAHERGRHRSGEDGPRCRRAHDSGDFRRGGVLQRPRQAPHGGSQARRDDW